METTVSLLQGVLDVASNVSQLGDNLFVADQTWLAYRREVGSLQGTLEDWNALVEDLELQDERNLVRCLEEVRLTLNYAHMQLTTMAKWEDRCGCLGHSVYAWAFPKSLEKSTEFLKAAATNVSTALAEQEQRRQQAERLRARQKVKSNTLSPDSRYVPLKGYQDDVYMALTDEGHDAPFLVFLHGEQGVGKTTLAWHVAANLKKGHGNRRASCSSTDSRDNIGDGVISCPPPAFDYVFFLSCGLLKNSDAVWTELEGRLELKPTAHGEDIFQGLGKEKRILLVLDDVQDLSVPKMAMNVGEHSKCRLKIFITSNKSDICDGCDDQRIRVIHLKGVDKADARTILARHVGLSFTAGKGFRGPKEIAQYMDEVVEKTRGNALALSCFATRIGKHRVYDGREWEDALEIFDIALKEESRANIYQDYPTSFWGMMRLCMEGMGDGAGQVLLLSVMIGQHSIREETVQLLYVYLNLGTRRSFVDARNILESRHLITSRCEAITNMTEEDDTIWLWDIHPTRRLYIQREGVSEGSIRTVKAMEQLIKIMLTNVNLKSMCDGDVKESEYDAALLLILCRHYVPQYWPPTKSFGREWNIYGGGSLYPLLARPCSDESRTSGTERWTMSLQKATKKMILWVVLGAEINLQDLASLFRSDVAFSPLIHTFEFEREQRFPFCGGKAEDIICTKFAIRFCSEILLEAVKMGMQDRLAFKVKHVLRYLRSAASASYFPDAICRSDFDNFSLKPTMPFMLEQFCHILGASSDSKITARFYQILEQMSSRIVGVWAIIQQPKIISLLMRSVCKSFDLRALRTLQNIAMSKTGCKVIISDKGELLKVVEICRTKSLKWELERELGYLLADLARYGIDIVVIESYLTGILQTLDTLYAAIDHEDHADKNKIRQLNSRLSLLYNITLFSDACRKIMINGGKLAIIYNLMDKGHLWRKETTAALWIRLMTNLARCGDSKKLLQGDVLLQRGLKNMCAILNEDQRLIQGIPHTGKAVADEDVVDEDDWTEYEDDDRFALKIENDDETILWKILESDKKQEAYLSVANYFQITSLAEVLTLLDLQEEMTYMKNVMTGADMQLLVSLACARAKVILGDFKQASAHLHQASSLNQGKGRRQREVDSIITRRQCYVMTMSCKWDEALRQVDHLSNLNMMEEDIQRGMIYTLMKKYDIAVQCFDIAMQRAVVEYKYKNNNTIRHVIILHLDTQEIWLRIKQRAHAKYLSYDCAGAEKDLLGAASFFRLEGNFTKVFFRVTPYVEYLEDNPLECVSDFLYSDAFYRRLFETEGTLRKFYQSVC